MAIPKGPIKAGKQNKPKVVKEGQIKKKIKDTKHKQTPQGKVSLINNKKNGNAQKKVANQSPSQKSAKKQLNVSNTKKNKKSPNSKLQEKKKNKEDKDDEEVMGDSDEDINEGVSLTEESMMEDDDDEASSEDESTPNIFGESLADDTDDDDNEFDADSDEAETPGEKKGVKMFKGVGPATTEESENQDGDDDDDEDEEDDDEEEDGDDDEDEEDEEDEDFDVSMEANRMKAKAKEADDEDDDEEEDDDEDDDADDDDDGPGLKALIGQSLVDDDDDEDFEGAEDDEDEDDDIDESDDDEDESLNHSTQSNNSTASTDGKKKMTPEEKEEQDKRTIFVGNVPKDIKESRVRAEFGKFGTIQSLRVRGVIPESPNMSFKVAAIKKKYHEKAKTVCMFIVYESEDSVAKALEINGKQLEGNYLRVDRANDDKQGDPKTTVFLGNLPFDIEDNELWEMFKKCGKVDYVRTIRDRNTGASRGIAYINFTTEDGAALALDLNGTKIRKREIRVVRYEQKAKKPKYQIPGKKRSSDHNQGNAAKKMRNEKSESENETSPGKLKKQKQKKPQLNQSQSPQKDSSFQGQSANAKKKGNKGNKFEKKKKAMAGKLLSKPKKPQ